MPSFADLRSVRGIALLLIGSVMTVWPSAGRQDRAAAATDRSDAAWVRLFDGRSLAGWHAVPPESASDWSVRDGMIVGRGHLHRQVFLVWRDEQLADFELEFEYRLPGQGNTGVELRARPDPTGKRPFEAYHADLGHVGIGAHILGAWDFHFARRPEPACPRGARLVFAPDGGSRVTAIPEAVKLSDIHRHDWNHARVVLRGRRGRFFLNGKLSAEFTDNAREGRLERGALGLQIHDPGMEVHFRNLRLRVIDPDGE